MLRQPERVKSPADPEAPDITMSAGINEAILDQAAANLLAMIEAEPLPDNIRQLALELTQALEARRQHSG